VLQSPSDKSKNSKQIHTKAQRRIPQRKEIHPRRMEPNTNVILYNKRSKAFGLEGIMLCRDITFLEYCTENQKPVFTIIAEIRSEL